MDIEWDLQKALTNLKKHDLCFDDAVHVLNSPTVSFEDTRSEYNEVRYITLGQLEGRVVIVVHTPRNGRTRIISMRKANEREKKIYYERLKEAGCNERQ